MLKKFILSSLMTATFVAHASLDSKINNIINGLEKQKFTIDSHTRGILYDLGQFLLDDKEPCATLTVTKYPGVSEIRFGNSQKQSRFLQLCPEKETKSNNSIFDHNDFKPTISMFLLKCSNMHMCDIEQTAAVIHGNATDCHLTSRYGKFIVEKNYIPTKPVCEIGTQTIPTTPEFPIQKTALKSEHQECLQRLKLIEKQIQRNHKKQL